MAAVGAEMPGVSIAFAAVKCGHSVFVLFGKVLGNSERELKTILRDGRKSNRCWAVSLFKTKASARYDRTGKKVLIEFSNIY